MPNGRVAELAVFAGFGRFWGAGDITVWSFETAWNCYVDHVAYLFASELLGLVPWTLASLDEAALDLLLDGQTNFAWYANSAYKSYKLTTTPLAKLYPATGYTLKRLPGQSLTVVPANPLFVWAFLKKEKILAGTRLQTIVNLLNWFREFADHSASPTDVLTAQGTEAVWQHRYGMPVSRLVDGTATFTVTGAFEFDHWTQGCQGSAAAMASILWSIGIPATCTAPCAHALPYFPSEDAYLSHADDPYNIYAHDLPIVNGGMIVSMPFASWPTAQLLIDGKQYDNWFGPTVTNANKCVNVGRQVYELAAETLPDFLLKLHCLDVADGLVVPASDAACQTTRVFKVLGDKFSVQMLKSLAFPGQGPDLWVNLQAKLDKVGGCSAVKWFGFVPGIGNVA